MSELPDDLANLLDEVRKTIRENEQFLQALIDDTAAKDLVEAATEDRDEEEFEEL
ncbi:MAG TPA: hypothetical protein VGJ93_06315 [Desulfuromonadaceae bacterium]|jgi:hypothetical protein